MTTGAYHDAIKAFSNADTVQHTAVAAFQRARCYCALSDLENAKMQFKIALDLIKNEALVKADS
jgi:dihydroxyacetone kinase DhaKLM complex PTS-EIIA-like component DhaM